MALISAPRPIFSRQPLSGLAAGGDDVGQSTHAADRTDHLGLISGSGGELGAVRLGCGFRVLEEELGEGYTAGAPEELS
jgi:hypothetical protein